jgi:hypothetical protein
MICSKLPVIQDPSTQDSHATGKKFQRQFTVLYSYFNKIVAMGIYSLTM